MEGHVSDLQGSNHNRRRIVASEAVADGRPDTLCDPISDALLGSCLTADPTPRRRCRSRPAAARRLPSVL